MTTQNEKMEEVLSRPTITPDELHRLGVLPLSRNGIYEACRNGELDHMRFGKKIAITTAPLRRRLGLGGA
jgi:hypothetical protein